MRERQSRFVATTWKGTKEPDGRKSNIDRQKNLKISSESEPNLYTIAAFKVEKRKERSFRIRNML